MVTTYPGLRFKYGYLQVVARIPSAPGLWPALWLAAANRQWPPEIDILEHWGTSARRTAVFYHPVQGPRLAEHPDAGDLSNGWHSFSLLWSRSRLVWYIDGRAVMSTSYAVPRQRMYFIADLAEYQVPSPRRGCEGSLLIKSLKLWQR